MLNYMLEDCKTEDEINLINDILTYIKHKNNIIKNKPNIKSDIQQRLSKIDNYMYKKPWNKLAPIHKKQKIKEYIQNYLFNAPEDNLEKIKKKIMNDLEKKKLNSAKKVKYDPVGSVILNIQGLEYDTNICEYSYK